jgi:hypothetical protein
MKTLRSFSKAVALILMLVILLTSSEAAGARPITRNVKIFLRVVKPVELIIPESTEEPEAFYSGESDPVEVSITRSEYRNKDGEKVILYTKIEDR